MGFLQDGIHVNLYIYKCIHVCDYNYIHTRRKYEDLILYLYGYMYINIYIYINIHRIARRS
jgi:hypothetical protein